MKLCYYKIFFLYGFIFWVGWDWSFCYIVNLVKRYLGLYVFFENVGKMVFFKKSLLDMFDCSN